jgi:hypothetical protein
MIANWKTTANGILSFLITTLTTLTAFQIPAAMLNPEQTHYLLWFTIGANLVVALCRVWVGMIQTDAKTVPEIAQKIVNGGGLAEMASTAPPISNPATK